MNLKKRSTRISWTSPESVTAKSWSDIFAGFLSLRDGISFRKMHVLHLLLPADQESETNDNQT